MRWVPVLAFVACAATASRVAPQFAPQDGDDSLPFQVDGPAPEQVSNRPSLINYNPVANSSAVVVSPDGMARFTVLTPRLIRMEYARAHGVFEDRSTIAVSACAAVIGQGSVFVLLPFTSP